MDRGAGRLHPWGCKELDTTERLTLSLHFFISKAAISSSAALEVFFLSHGQYPFLIDTMSSNQKNYYQYSLFFSVITGELAFSAKS